MTENKTKKLFPSLSFQRYFKSRPPSSAKIIALGILIAILIGAVLLSLPISSRSGEAIRFPDALFTSVSATCVTGLVVTDTYSTWSLFGQLVILCLIQIGGLGFMTVITMFSMFLKRRIGLGERRLLMESAGTIRISGVVRLMKRIIAGTFIFEGAGAVLLSLRFCPEMGLARGIYNAVFHSVSAFCNAGFDLMGKYGEFSSLTGHFANDVLVNLTLMFLIVTGGLGFLVWNDIVTKKLRFRNYELHSKIVLTVTASLIVGGTVLFFIFENDAALSGMPFWDKLLASAFQSVTYRTAGFNTVDLTSLSESGNILAVILMFIGGSPGSTAGGIKTTTFAVLILGAAAASRHSNSLTVFRKRLQDSALRQACAIFTIYMTAVVVSSSILCMLEPISIRESVFEVVSAVGTVGLTEGITPSLCFASRLFIMLLMYGGRVGGLTFMLSLAEKRFNIPLERPEEKILIG